MKTKISYEMGQLALASLVGTLFLVFIYFMIAYPSGLFFSSKAIVYGSLVWFGFIFANLGREYLKLRKKVVEEIIEEARLTAKRNEVERTAKKARINSLRPIPAVRKKDVLFIAELYNNGDLAQLDYYFRFDRILEFPIYRFISISEAKKQVIFSDELSSVLKMYRKLYNDCANDKNLKIIVKHIIETKELIARLDENHYKGSKNLMNNFHEHLRVVLEDIIDKDLFDFDVLQRVKINDLTGE